MTGKRMVFVVCGVLRREVDRIVREEYPDADTVFLDSMLHMHPERLRVAIEEEMRRFDGTPVVLVYGDCHAHMQETCERGFCSRTGGMNCCELLLGHEHYRRLQRENVFIFLPEWTERWKEVFAGELGLSDRNQAASFMREMRSGLIYLDTGILAVPDETLEEIGNYFGMKVQVLPVTLDRLREEIKRTVGGIHA
jgi:hypothetical protein